MRYKKKPFQPELEDIHEGEEMAALKSSSSSSDVEDRDKDKDDDDDDDIVVFRRGKPESVNTEKPLELSLMTSLFGLDFW